MSEDYNFLIPLITYFVLFVFFFIIMIPFGIVIAKFNSFKNDKAKTKRVLIIACILAVIGSGLCGKMWY